MRLISKTVAVMATAALTAGGLAATTTGAASAENSAERASAKRFNFISSAYGTRVYNKNGNLVDSGRTAWSFIACTSKTGKTKRDHLVQAKLPGSQLKVGGVTTNAKTRSIKGGVRSLAETKVGDIVVKAPIGSLKIEGLKGKSQTTYKNGKYSQKGSVDLLGIKASLGGVNFPLPGFDPDNINPGQEIKIPGLVKLRFLDTKGKVKSDEAHNNSVALEIKLLTGGPLKGQTVRVGSARTKLEGIAKKGKLHGYGQAARAKLLNGVVSSGRIGHRPMPCVGTDGKWKRNSVAGLNIPGLPIRVGAASGQANGRLEPGKKPVSHTRARIAEVKLTNALKIGAVESWAKVVKNGKKYKKRSGVNVVRVQAGGRNWTKQINRAIKKNRSITIPGIAKITPNVVKKKRKSVSVTALRIRLLDVAKPLRSTIHLANSNARIK